MLPACEPTAPPTGPAAEDLAPSSDAPISSADPIGDQAAGTIFALAFFDTTQVMPPGRLDLDIVPDAFPLGIALHVHGELDAHLGSGTVSMIWPRLTEDVRAQRCQTGEQTWRLWRTDAGF
jgi:hypothetical protein